MSEFRDRTRRLYLRHEYLTVYVVSSIVYIALGLRFHLLLNWIVGPLWPVVCMWFVPVAVRRAFKWDVPLPDESAP